MATKELREAKDHNVRVRCTPQEKFAIEFAARVARKSYSHLVLDAVAPVVEAATWRGKSWRDYEDPTPGYAWCLMFRDGLPTNKEEDDLKRFVLSHRDFFFDGDTPSRRRLDVLWSRVPHFADSYFRKMKTDNHAIGAEMNKALVEAKCKPNPSSPNLIRPSPLQNQRRVFDGPAIGPRQKCWGRIPCARSSLPRLGQESGNVLVIVAQGHARDWRWRLGDAAQK